MTSIGPWSAEVSAKTAVPIIGDWQLPADHFEPSHIQPRIIAPRPDVERTYASRYSWAYPGIEYAVPIVVLGGSYPFYYEITARTGPASVSNAAIGNRRAYNIGMSWYESQDWEDYGTLRWTPAANDEGQAFSFTVRVTGQDGTSAAVTFGGTVQANKFVFVQDGAAPGGNGTIGSPYEDFADLWTGPEDLSFDGKIIVFRAGTYLQENVSTPNLQNNPTLPRAYINYPGERWTMIMNPSQPGGTGSTYWRVGVEDIFWTGCIIDGTAYDLDGSGTSSWVFCEKFQPNSGHTTTRHVYWLNTFQNWENTQNDGTTSNNGLACFLAKPEKPDMAFVKNVITDCAASGKGPNWGACFEFYYGKYVVYEHNVHKNSTMHSGLWCKYGCDYVSARANLLWNGSDFSSMLVLGNAISSSGQRYACGPQEVCWNFFEHIDGDGKLDDLGWRVERYDIDDGGPGYHYRNTYTATQFNRVILCVFKKLTLSSRETLLVKNNALRQSSPAYPKMFAIQTTEGSVPSPEGTDRLSEAEADAGWGATGTFTGNVNSTEVVFDADGRMQGAFATYRGLKGAYIE